MFAASKTASVSGGYQISRSLRFNSADSAYLNRTPASASNRKTWTWSAWVKRGLLLTTNVPQNLFGARNGSGSPYTLFRFDDGTTGTANGLLFQDDNGATLRTTAQYRDVSAWYHIVLAVDTTQATASNRVRLYINNVEVTAFSTATYPTQNLDTAVNSTNDHRIGNQPVYGDQFNGYMTEVYLIDGSQLTPSSFGETNAQTGVWQPKAYSGSYGTNGFYLNFSDNSNTTAATLGKDYSGNGNNWTPNNFSVSAGAGNDSLVDSPTSYGTTDTGVGGEIRGNYSTLNPLNLGANASLSNGNLDSLASGAVYSTAKSTMGVSSGKWYVEARLNTAGYHMVGISSSSAALSGALGTTADSYSYFSISGQKYNNGTLTSYGATFTSGDIISIVLDMDAGTLTFYKNGTTQGTAFTGLTGTFFFGVTGDGSSSGSWSINFGQRPFAYTAPSGYKALCTQNLPTPTIGATSTTLATKYFNPVTYAGNGGTQSVTGVGFQPDFVWVKNRTAANGHGFEDVLRGAGKTLASDSTAAEVDYSAYFTAFTSDGFNMALGGGTFNNGTSNYVAWNWKANGSGSSNTAGSITSTVSANTTSGFSVVTYAGNSTLGATIGHGLGVAPSMIIVKSRSATTNWPVYHASIGNTKALFLNLTNATDTDNYWNNTSPTSSVFSVNASTGLNSSGSNYVAYCFAEVAGYSKFGSYTGNASTDGPFIYCGFRPAYVMFKNASISGNWEVYDTTRNTYNTVDNYLLPNVSDAEGVATNRFDYLSNGIKVRNTGSSINGTGNTIIFMAFASNPFKYSLAR